MKRMCRLTLVLALAVLISSPALAQRGERPRGERGPRFGMGSLFLLSQESVQKELKLSDDQVKKIQELQEKQLESFRGLGDLSPEERRTKMQEQSQAAEKSLNEILKPEQQKRIKQIVLQQEGARAFSRKEVAEALKLTDEQKEKIKTIQEEARKEMGDLQNSGSFEEARKKMTEIRKNTREKVLNVLTSEQKAKLKEMEGEPFKGEIRFPQGRRGGRQAQR